MKVAKFVRGLFLILAMWGWTAAGAEIVYDNSDIAAYSGVDYETTDEYGDEVFLGGTARIVTEIQIEYYAQFTRQGDEIGRVRFYQNTGPLWMNKPDAKTPASPPLFEQTFQVSTGYQVLVMSVPSVLVPDSFTWTVQFLGISQSSTNDRAGLLFYGTPTVGQSFDDFWQRLSDGWAVVFQEGVKSNFGARIIAEAAPAGPRLAITRSGNNIVLSWPTSSPNFVLESKSNLSGTSWTTVTPAPTVNGSNFQVVLPIGAGNLFFRLRSP